MLFWVFCSPSKNAYGCAHVTQYPHRIENLLFLLSSRGDIGFLSFIPRQGDLGNNSFLSWGKIIVPIVTPSIIINAQINHFAKGGKETAGVRIVPCMAQEGAMSFNPHNSRSICFLTISKVISLLHSNSREVPL